ncbi:hypothetical protein [Ornithinibacillus halotolerans]|uniref:Uncharacterized protein n=1 Tax=Ornithinibacillus halotolerans TaxID=1274357 RepID=A0A916W8Q6_9BACI|nr:hypothetical protein [Ornithinibacillus halotolerans]GGA77227.1 hypothetical protein GCM10008025_21070 [Ornithinibacillus halotolerans]
MDKGDFILTDYIVFDSKPDAVPYHYRLSFKISLACLILGLSCGRSGCSLSKLHLIIVSMYSEKEKNTLLNYVNGDFNQYLILRFDPTINKTVDFMLAEKIIFQQSNGLFRLTTSGKSFLEKIMDDDKLLISEKEFLKKLSNKLTENVIDKLKRTLMG